MASPKATAKQTNHALEVTEMWFYRRRLTIDWTANVFSISNGIKRSYAKYAKETVANFWARKEKETSAIFWTHYEKETVAIFWAYYEKEIVAIFSLHYEKETFIHNRLITL